MLLFMKHIKYLWNRVPGVEVVQTVSWAVCVHRGICCSSDTMTDIIRIRCSVVVSDCDPYQTFLYRIKRHSSWFWMPRHLRSWEEPMCLLTSLMASMEPLMQLHRSNYVTLLIQRILNAVSCTDYYYNVGINLHWASRMVRLLYHTSV